jgi:hypothetical protein
MKRIAWLVLVLWAMPLGGCAEFAKAWPVIKSIIDKVSDAGQILSMIDVHARAHFRENPDPEKEAVYDKAFIATTAALNGATRLTKGVDHLTKEQEHEAFAEFRATFEELRKLIGGYGIMKPDGTLGASGSGTPIVVPEPLALTP